MIIPVKRSPHSTSVLCHVVHHVLLTADVYDIPSSSGRVHTKFFRVFVPELVFTLSVDDVAHEALWKHSVQTVTFMSTGPETINNIC